MASGQQIAQENVQVFTTWRGSKTDDEFRSIVHRGVLSRREIATECGFARSALDQNPRVKALLSELEDELRARGVLPPAIETTSGDSGKSIMREANTLRAALDTERVRRLELDNASLKAEVAELKRSIKKHTILSEALAHTGRIPR